METSRRKALGRGLEELFNNEPIDYERIEEKIMEDTSKEEIVEIPLKELRSNPYQPRKVFDQDALNELAASIKEHGVFQPIIAKKSIKGYEIIAGERRVKASLLAGLETIPAIIRDFTDQDMMEIALLENLQRENLNALEEAQAYKKLIEQLSLTQEELAKRLGKSRSHITNMIGLLTLPEEVKEEISSGKLTMGHARVLSKIEDVDKVKELANIEEKITVEVSDLDEKYISRISELKNVDIVTYSGNTLLITYKKGKNNITEIMDFLRNNKIKYNKIFSERPTLNDVFLELTGKELRD